MQIKTPLKKFKKSPKKVKNINVEDKLNFSTFIIVS